MVVGTRVQDLVDGYPPTAENYDKCIDSLRMRFGREGLLIEFYKKNIYVPDVGSLLLDSDLLLGADALGLIYTGKLIKLVCGLTTVETHLGFALMDKETKINQAKSLSIANEQQKPRSAMSMLSNQILSLNIKELGSLETIGIRDPVENLKERELNSEFIKWFKDPTLLGKESGDWQMTKINCEVKEPEELPIAAVVMERVPESPTKSDYSDQEVNPELTEVTPVIDVCKFSRCGRKIKPPQKLD
ncbi:hypothetical protein TNCV_5058901 [Trichonephila clavipes]|nr:hypothetical protein TNCV_5058901 [Trichonephila clavipes]